MKLASIHANGVDRLAIVDEAERRVFPLDKAPPDMIDLIYDYDRLRSDLVAVGIGLAFDEVRWNAPIARPRRNIFCVGKNYREHALEFSRSGFEAGAKVGDGMDAYPAVFTKPPSTVTATSTEVSLHAPATDSVDYEAELAVIIGKAGRDIRAADAFSHIWGYTIVNDVTARDRQKNHKQWFLGKALDGFCPMGPWVSTVDEVDATNLTVECKVNGETRQKANTSDLVFGIATLIEAISAGLTILPGDIIATGTPAGVGIGFDPPRFLKAGDVVDITITGLGTLTNTFR